VIRTRGPSEGLMFSHVGLFMLFRTATIFSSYVVPKADALHKSAPCSNYLPWDRGITDIRPPGQKPPGQVPPGHCHKYLANRGGRLSGGTSVGGLSGGECSDTGTEGYKSQQHASASYIQCLWTPTTCTVKSRLLT